VDVLRSGLFREIFAFGVEGLAFDGDDDNGVCERFLEFVLHEVGEGEELVVCI
jgi:hypothetical protein